MASNCPLSSIFIPGKTIEPVPIQHNILPGKRNAYTSSFFFSSGRLARFEYLGRQYLLAISMAVSGVGFPRRYWRLNK